MKKAKKLIALVIVVCVCMTLFAACGNKDNGGSDTGSGATTGDSSGSSSTGSGSTNSGSTNSGSTSGSGTTGDSQAPENVAGGGLEAAGSSGIPSNSMFRTVAQQYTPRYNPPPAGAKLADEITVIMENFIPSVINPWISGGTFSASFWEYIMVHARLIFPTDKKDEYLPHLAKSWSHNDDYTVFTFNLRDDVYFHNGEQLKASDVVFTFDLAMRTPGAPAFTNWTYVKEVKAIDDFTVEMTTKDPNVDLLFYMASAASCIASEKAYADDPEDGYKIGAGAYKLAEFVSGEYWVVERNENYWGPAPFTRKITARFIPEIGTRAIMLKNGDGVFCARIAVEDMSIFEDDNDWLIYDRVLNNPMGIALNTTAPVTNDLNFRKAVRAALDRELISIALYAGYAAPNYTGTTWGLYTEFRNNNLPDIEESIDLAKDYLAKSSYNGEVVELLCATSHVRAMEAVQYCLTQVGINTQINAMENPAITPYIEWGNNQSQISWMAAGFNLSAASLRTLYMPEGRQNRMEYVNPAIVDAMDKAMVELNESTRETLYKQAQEIFYDDACWFSVFWSIDTAVAHNGFDGYMFNMDGFYDFTYAYYVIG